MSSTDLSYVNLEEMDVLKIESRQIKLFVCSESCIYGNMVIYANLCYQTIWI